MAVNPVDHYLDALDEPARSTLRQLRDTLAELLPEAVQTLSYGAPAFKVRGKTVAGFAAHKQHLNYLPHSGTVVSALGDELAGYETTKGSVKLGLDSPLPKDLVRKLVDARLSELGFR